MTSISKIDIHLRRVISHASVVAIISCMLAYSTKNFNELANYFFKYVTLIFFISLGILILIGISRKPWLLIKSIIINARSVPVIEVSGFVSYGIVQGLLINTYADFITGVWSSLILIYLFTTIIERLKLDVVSPPNLQGLLSDMPEENTSLLVNSQERQIEMLEKIIIEQPMGRSISVAIDGKWGDAKSTIVKTVENRLSANRDIIWINFETWRYPNQDDLIVNFYDLLGRRIASSVPTIASDAKRLASFARTIVKVVDEKSPLSNILSAMTDAPDVVQKLSGKLTRYNKRIVIVIDDIDRLNDRDQLTRIIQLSHVIKAYDFPGSIILLPADFEVVASTLKIDPASEYLQKISEFTLPTVAPTARELLDYINKYIHDDFTIEPYHLRLIRNFRGAKRVVNQYTMLLERLRNQVDPKDIFTMCTLSHAAPTIFADIRNYQKMYVEPDNEADIAWWILEEKEKYTIRSKHYEKLSNQLQNNELKSDIQRAIEDTFFTMKNALKNGTPVTNLGEKEYRQKRIGFSTVLANFFYFSEEVLITRAIEDKANAFFREYMNESVDKRQEYARSFFEGIDSEQIGPLITEIIDGHFEDSVSKREVMIRLGNDLLKALLKKSQWLRRDDHRYLSHLLSKYDPYLSSEEQRARFLHEIGDLDVAPDIMLTFLIYINPHRNNQLYNLHQYTKYDSLRTRILRKIDSYYLTGGHNAILEDRTDDDNWRFTLYQWGMSVWCDDINSIVRTRREKVSKYVNRLLRLDPQIAHRFIRTNYYQQNLGSVDDEYRYTFNIEQPYNLGSIIAITKSILKRKPGSLNEQQLQDLKDFVSEYKVYKQEHG